MIEHAPPVARPKRAALRLVVMQNKDMKKLLSYLFLSTLILMADIVSGEVVINSSEFDGRYQYENGKMVRYSGNRIVGEYEINAEGLKHGKWVIYYRRTNAVNYEFYYINGIKHGPDLEYYTNGQVTVRKHYDNGELIEGIKYYYDTGVLKGEIPVANGKRNGLSRFYYPNGQLESVWEYVDNRSTPIEKYYENGKKHRFVKLKYKCGRASHEFGNWFMNTFNIGPGD